MPQLGIENLEGVLKRRNVMLPNAMVVMTARASVNMPRQFLG